MTAAEAPLASARIRSRMVVSLWRNVAIVVPILLVLFAVSLGVGLLFDNVQVSLIVLTVLVVPVFWGAMRFAAHRDFMNDARNPKVRVYPDAIVIPFQGTERRLPRSEVAMAPGFYDRRFIGTARVVDKRIGIFLFLRHGDFKVALLAIDHLRDARERGIKHYTDAPEEVPYVPVWSQELLPLMDALGIDPTRRAKGAG